MSKFFKDKQSSLGLKPCEKMVTSRAELEVRKRLGPELFSRISDNDKAEFTARLKMRLSI